MKNKRICALILAVLMLLSFCSCAFTEKPNSDEKETEQETEQENERENEFVVEEGTEMYEVFYTEQMPPLVRTAGYKDPVLSDRTAIDTIVKEAFPMLFMAAYSGLNQMQDMLYGRYWIGKEENIVPPIPTEEYPYLVQMFFISAFDTEEKFDEYYLKVFTEDTVKFIKTRFEICEIDGRLAGNNAYHTDWGSITDYDLTTVKSMEYIDDKTVRVELIFYGIEGEPWDTGENIYTLIYSDEYGWRMDFDSLKYIFIKQIIFFQI